MGKFAWCQSLRFRQKVNNRSSGLVSAARICDTKTLSIQPVTSPLSVTPNHKHLLHPEGLKLFVDLRDPEDKHNSDDQTTQHPPQRTHQMQLRPTTLQQKPVIHHTHIPSPSVIEPTSFTQAVKLPEWKQAMTEEMQALYRNHTWDLVPRPSNNNVVGNRWLYKIKR